MYVAVTNNIGVRNDQNEKEVAHAANATKPIISSVISSWSFDSLLGLKILFGMDALYVKNVLVFCFVHDHFDSVVDSNTQNVHIKIKLIIILIYIILILRTLNAFYSIFL